MPTPTSKRIELQQVLESIIGSNYVYYRPPESTKLKYPCIIYNLKSGVAHRADNANYIFKRCYDVQLIHKTADTDLVEALIGAFPYIRFDNNFITDNLIHENFVLYY